VISVIPVAKMLFKTGCLQLLEILEILEISWDLKFLLEISWIFVDAPGKIYNQQCNFCTLRHRDERWPELIITCSYENISEFILVCALI